MLRPLSTILFTALVLSVPTFAAERDSRSLSFVVSYRGLLSAGLPLDIVSVNLVLAPARSDGGQPVTRVTLAASTDPYPAAELVYPMEFCYRSEVQAHRTATLAAEWWSHIGAKETRGQLSFDRAAGLVRSYEVKRKTGDGPPAGTALAELAAPLELDKGDDAERSQSPYPADALPLDRLTMLMWLREQPLKSGVVLEPAVSNGRQLTGYRIRVEGEEPVKWNGAPRPAWRIRLEPRVDDGSDTSPSWLWLSRDATRLPLLLRTRRAFGSFEMRLQPGVAGTDVRCVARLGDGTATGG